MCFEPEDSKAFKKEVDKSRCLLLSSVEKAETELFDFISWLNFKQKQDENK